MKTYMKWLAAFCALTVLILSYACNKDNSGSSGIPAGKSNISIYMMDDPIMFTKVLIDIRQVAVLIDTSTKQTDSDDVHQWNDDWCGRGRHKENKSVFWDTLNITPGVYDLLSLRNGTDTLLASGNYPTGKILKVKITLGSDNTVFTDSATSYPLEVFGPSPSFVINVRREHIHSVSSDQFKLWLDFNLSHSIFFWSGTFYLKPFVIAFNDVKYAKLKGQVLPEHAGALVTAWTGTDTLYAIPNEDGRYQFRGVNTGSYSINFKGRGDYQDTTISGITVDSAQTTIVPTITLHK